MTATVIRSSDLWVAVLVEAGLPSSQERLREGQALFEKACSFLSDDCTQAPETFLLGRRMYLDGGADLLSESASFWRPKVGIGLWPNRPAPRRKTAEDAMDEAADMLQSREPEKTADVMLRVTGQEEAKIAARRTLFGRGVLVLVFSSQAFTVWEHKTRARFLPTILDTSYHFERFYLPQFDRICLQGAADEELTDWMCGAEGYLQENATDSGFLLLCRPKVADLIILAAAGTLSVV